ncbi:MAG: hypothetical protein ACR2PX_23570 [Endozoicomonas sp.]|uniref:hypothetical protein n=1 Tax=Endozoicomonas sp. TaxID=1892382 RepID=UPI003D9AE1CD
MDATPRAERLNTLRALSPTGHAVLLNLGKVSKSSRTVSPDNEGLGENEKRYAINMKTYLERRIGRNWGNREFLTAREVKSALKTLPKLSRSVVFHEPAVSSSRSPEPEISQPVSEQASPINFVPQPLTESQPIQENLVSTTNGSWLLMDSGELSKQHLQKTGESCFSPFSDVVQTLEET